MRKKKIQKILACFLVTTCMTGMLMGCGDQSSNTTKTSETMKESETIKESEVTEIAETEPEGVIYPIEEEVTLTIAMVEQAQITAQYNDISETPFGKAWQEATGVKLEVQQYADNSALNLMIASGELPDIIYFSWNLYNGGISQAVRDGVIAPVSDYIEYAPDYMAVLESDDSYRKGVMTSDNEIAGFHFIRGDEYLLTSQGLMLRQDLLDQLGMEVPNTADELYELLKAFKNELNIEKPFSIDNGMLNNAINYGIITSPFGLPRASFYVKDGEIHYGSYESEYKAVLEYLNKLYDEKLLDPEFATVSGGVTNANFMNGVSAVTSAAVGGGLGTFLNTMTPDNPTWNATGFGPLVAKDGDIAMSSHVSDPIDQRAAVITTSCENKEAAAMFLNYGYTEAGHMLFNFGVEGESYEMVDGYPTYTDLVMKNPDGLSVQHAMTHYHRAANGAGPFVQDKRYMEQYSSWPQQRAALESWTTSNALDYMEPTLIIPDEYSAEYNKLWADINTYVNEMRIKYITGLKDLDAFESEYITTLKEMGIDRILEIRQIAFDVYNAR